MSQETSTLQRTQQRHKSLKSRHILPNCFCDKYAKVYWSQNSQRQRKINIHKKVSNSRQHNVINFWLWNVVWSTLKNPCHPVSCMNENYPQNPRSRQRSHKICNWRSNPARQRAPINVTSCWEFGTDALHYPRDVVSAAYATATSLCGWLAVRHTPVLYQNS